MRLICPNCGAQYEVADDVIPEDGRDVQCSNCAHTWFEDRGASGHEDEDEDEGADIPQAPEPSHDESEEEWGAADYATKPETAPKAAPKRQELDPAIADILREEAAREAAVRRAEAEPEMQSQPDLGLDSANAAPDQRSAEAQKRMALLKGEPSPQAPSASPNAASRSGLLPDIEEINSTLRAESERNTYRQDLPEAAAAQKLGFRAGFFGALFLLGLFAAAYIFAPQIRASVPALEGPLTTYSETVDNGRLWLDAKMRDMLEAMNKSETPTPDAPAPSVETDAPELAPLTE